MVIQLTDEQIVRVLALCTKIAKTSQELPAPPAGYEVSLEVARSLRTSLLNQNDVLLDLGALLR